MRLDEIVLKLNMKVCCCEDKLGVEVANGYVSDMLSDVLANSDENYVWITLQIHPNIVAIASMKGLAGIIIINGREPEAETIAKAQEKGMPILVSEMGAFELSGKLYAFGLCGSQSDAEGL